MKTARYRMKLSEIPVDFFADPDGEWTYEALVEASGFDGETQTVCIGALTAPFEGHPEGSAVITITQRRGRSVVIVECDRVAQTSPAVAVVASAVA
ncbi:MAG TPA: hypothetical protein VL137_14685 [Polyangiaceae bacterium]|nr:hypothetical protein [Polyangiaceae bacterium]